LKFQGSICAIVTPLTPAGAIDLPAFRQLIDWHAAAGTHAVVVGGSTGESASIDAAELDALLETALARVGGRMGVIAGCGAAATHKSLAAIRRARAIGADAALVVTPYYVRPTQEGLYRHYATLADEGGLPVILYNVPSRTGCDMLPETVARLAPRAGIAGVKEAVAAPERMQALLPLRSDTFAVLSGDDPTAVRALRAGADGVISVAANVAPATFRRLTDLARQGAAEALALDEKLAPLYAFLGAEPNPIPVKWLLHRLGACAPTLRLPLVELSAAQHAAADACAQLVRTLERDLPTSNAA
jgi:4-hydroxy-tetrahydrodipicolinate synthase